MATERTSKGLVDMLFATIDQLNAKEIDVDTARALSHTARTIIAVARLELEYRQMSADNPDSNLASLRINTDAIDPPKLPQ